MKDGILKLKRLNNTNPIYKMTKQEIETLKGIVNTGFNEHSHLLKSAIEKGQEWDYQTLSESIHAFDAICVGYQERYDDLAARYNDLPSTEY
jgi:hypothetical protein